ncbi:MAG: Fur family transcriptional regulator [Polyangiales bacterium]
MPHASTTTELKNELRAAGLRATGSRVGVLRSVRKAARPVALADVMERLGDEAPDRATVYRNLLDLAEAGLLRRAHLGDAWRFEGGDESEHAHFICTQCGIVECTPDVSLNVSTGAKAPGSVREGDFRVQLHGVCDDCS